MQVQGGSFVPLIGGTAVAGGGGGRRFLHSATEDLSQVLMEMVEEAEVVMIMRVASVMLVHMAYREGSSPVYLVAMRSSRHA